MGDLLDGATLRSRWLTYQAAAIAGFVVLALTNVRPIELGAAIVGTVLVVATRLLGPWTDAKERTLSVALVTAVGFVAIGLAAGPWRPYMLVTTVFLLPMALAVAYFAWRGRVDDRSLRIGVTAILVLMVGIIGMLWIVPVEPPVSDMLDLHASAAEVLLDGRNPYSDAYAVSTNPEANEGEEYIGYPYPPLTMIAYAGSHILFGDSRWASVIAMAAVVILVVRPWRAMTRPLAGALIAVALALVLYPWLGTLVWFGWTDPVSLPLLLAGALLWRRHPVLSAVLFGLAFGTKQYFVLALPLMLAWPDQFRWKRMVIAGGVAALTILPFLFIDPAALWNATMSLAVNATPRRAASGLSSLGLDVPFWALVVIGVGMAVWMARPGGGSPRFLLGLGATLSVVFLVGFIALMNYWFLVGMVAVFAVVAALDTDADSVIARSVDPAGAQPDTEG